MGARRFVTITLLMLGGLLAVATAAHAQSGIAGVTKDTTGAVLPGVTVEVSSPALIEGVRSAVTDGQGQYRVTNLRPGIYSVKFTLPGFGTIIREGIPLESDFTANVNVEMQVGLLQETVTVSGAAPLVDIHSTEQRTVLTKELLDTLPAARTAFTNTVPAIVMGPDVGGSNAMTHTQMNVYGSTDRQDIQIEGMSMMGAGGNPDVYYNYDSFEEVAYKVGAGGDAESTNGGVIVSMVMRQGGNTFSGDGTLVYADEHTQNSNYTDELKARGLQAPSAIKRLHDVNVSVGGPIMRDKLWFFSSYRHWATNSYVANAFLPDGKQASDEPELFNITNRLTYQINRNNKISAMHDRAYKNQAHRGFSAGFSPEAAFVSTTPVPINNVMKWTSTVSPRLLVDVGFSSQFYSQRSRYEPEVAGPSATNPYGDIAKTDLITGRTWNASPGGESMARDLVYHVNSSVSYVTGSHSVKIGHQFSRGYAEAGVSDRHADLVQEYRNGVPASVVVYNSPTSRRTDLDFEHAVFGQDSWKIGRFTLNPGLRFQHFRNSIPEQQAPAGRFVPARSFAAIPKVIDWTDVSPRVGGVYDLFGDGQTALKASIGKYVVYDITQRGSQYNPMLVSGGSTDSTDRRTWTDLNRDDIAQENELGPSSNSTFGVRRNLIPDPNLKRPYSWLTSVGIDQQLRPGLGASASYVRRDFRQLIWTDNLATTFDDYTLITIPDPRGNGQTLPVYNLSARKLGLIDLFDSNGDQQKRMYEGVDFSLTSRFGRGNTLMAAGSVGRTRNVTCQVDDPNALRFCDDTKFHIPFRPSLRLVGSYTLPYDVSLSGVFQSSWANGNNQVEDSILPTNYLVTRAIVPTLTQAQVTVRLDEPGTQYRDRINQLDLSIGKNFRRGGVEVRPRLDIANVLNANPVRTQVTTFGPSLGTVTSILTGRLMRFNVQVKF